MQSSLHIVRAGAAHLISMQIKIVLLIIGRNKTAFSASNSWPLRQTIQVLFDLLSWVILILRTCLPYIVYDSLILLPPSQITSTRQKGKETSWRINYFHCCRYQFRVHLVELHRFRHSLRMEADSVRGKEMIMWLIESDFSDINSWN